MRDFLRLLKSGYDRYWLHAYSLQIAAYFGGAYLQRGQDHHGSWEWLGWTCWGLSVVLVCTVTARLRRAKCTKLHAEIIDKQRSKAKWS